MTASPSTADALGWLMAGMFVAIGLILGAGAAWVAGQNLQAIAQHERIVGAVHEVRWPPGRKPGERIGKGETFSITVRFRWRGYTRHASFESQHSGWERGEAVAVYVDPERPWKITPDSLFDLWFIPLLLGSIAGLGLFYGGRMMFELRRPPASGGTGSGAR